MPLNESYGYHLGGMTRLVTLTHFQSDMELTDYISYI